MRTPSDPELPPDVEIPKDCKKAAWEGLQSVRTLLGSDESCMSENLKSRALQQVNQIADDLKRAFEAQERLLKGYHRTDQQTQLVLAVVTQTLRHATFSLKGLIELVRESESLPDHWVSALQSNSLSLNQALDDLSSFSAIRNQEVIIRRYPFSPHTVFEEILQAFQLRIDASKVNLRLNMAPGIPKTLMGDAGRLRQALVTVLETSVRLTFEGEITVEVDWKSEIPQSLNIHIHDSGMGFAHKALGGMLNQHREHHEPDAGDVANVELSLVREILHQLGGNMQVKSVLGEGTACTIRFPAEVASKEQSETTHPTRIQHQNAKILPSPAIQKPTLNSRSRSHETIDFCRVLLVDDDPISAMVLKRLLEQQNCRVSVADGGRIALEWLAREDYDLIFMDCVMPGMDGFETTECIRRNGNTRTPIIAVTASSNPDNRKLCIRAGMNDVMPKPVDLVLLRSTIDRWLGGRVRSGTDGIATLKAHQESLAYPETLFESLLSAWLECIPDWNRALNQALEAGESNAFVNTCYRIRCSLSQIGIEYAYSEIRQMEEYAKSSKWHLIPERLQSLENLLIACRETVEHFLRQYQDPTSTQPEKLRNVRNVIQAEQLMAEHLVMVVDPDPLSRMVFTSLAPLGLRVQCHASASEAIEATRDLETESIGCIICSENPDSRTPLADSLRLMGIDPSLSVLVLSHFPTKQMVNLSMKAGIHELIAKPAPLHQLVESILVAVGESVHKRHQRRNQVAASRIGSAQSRLLSGSSGEQNGVNCKIVSLPKSEAGGDFWVKVDPEPGHQAFFLSDVSGHDIEAAFVSAYFHGLVRGASEFGKRSVRASLEAFNGFLCNEWNRKTEGRSRVEKSVACCAADLNREQGTLEFHLCGSCIPILIQNDGGLESVAPLTGVPLGWFDPAEIHSIQLDPSHAKGFVVWSDGIEALASELGVNPMSVARKLIRESGPRGNLNWAQQANDDLLVAQVEWIECDPSTACYPIFFVKLPGDQHPRIDEIQEELLRSLEFLLPKMPDELRHDVILCAREGLLNALLHGCKGNPEHLARMAIFSDSTARKFRIWIHDDGKPIDPLSFELLRHSDQSHRGMELMASFASAFHFDSQKKTLELQFHHP
jgi:CheY-like chemotaxis protein/anti-sigma regulatory factor (Ser/Thr protein kinase)